MNYLEAIDLISFGNIFIFSEFWTRLPLLTICFIGGRTLKVIGKISVLGSAGHETDFSGINEEHNGYRKIILFDDDYHLLGHDTVLLL
jgi:hypothetical protein